MIAAVVFALLAVAALFWFRSKRKSGAAETESTPLLDAWIARELEVELAANALGLARSTEEERRPLARTLRNEPDADVVTKLEAAVNAVELEFVRYAHEATVEVTLRVRYEDGKTGAATRRFDLVEVPDAVRADFTTKGATRVFRAWTFPWQRVAMS